VSFTVRPASRAQLGSVLLASAAVGISVYRAATQSITHDEARVFQLYMLGSVRHAFAYTGIQNHVLQAFLSRLTLSVLPATAFAIRIPTLIATAIYCAAVIVICGRLFTDRWMRWAAVALLTWHPYTLDFLSAARGYGLMLAFLMLATAALLPDVSPFRERRAHLLAGVSLGLAIAATTACMFAVAGIVFAYAGVLAMQGEWADAVKRATTLAATACVVAALPLANQLYRASAGDYQNALSLGGDSFLLQMASLMRASTSRQNPYLVSVSALNSAQVAALAIAAVAVIGAVALASARVTRWRAIDSRERAAVWLVAMLLGMASATVAAHVLFHMSYPQARMALYWIPFVTLTLLAAWSGTAAATPLRWAGWVLATSVLAVDLSLCDVSTYADWIADAPDETLIQHIVQDHGTAGRRATVGGSWVLEPSINFYRITKRLDWMDEMERRPPQKGDDYYVLIKQERDVVDRLGLRVLYEDHRTGTLVATASE
jgi:hypothetical protein